LPASAVSYLSALSQADAQARARSVPPTSTPALSLSSSITSSSEDTILHENDTDDLNSNANGLLYPTRPPTSEQVFATVHTEFGHCADERYRTTSQHKPGAPLATHVEQDPPYYILLSTYISYLILICLGHVRDFMGKRLYPARYQHLMPRNVSSAPLFACNLVLSFTSMNFCYSVLILSLGLCPTKLGL
jgi:serine palmitoyltransferase